MEMEVPVNVLLISRRSVVVIAPAANIYPVVDDIEVAPKHCKF
jgi:hypothetical protein